MRIIIVDGRGEMYEYFRKCLATSEKNSTLYD